MNFVEKLSKFVLNGGEISRDDAIKLWQNGDLDELLNNADKIRKYFCKDKFSLCSIINAKSGKCSEDCKFCAQSSRYKTNCENYALLQIQTFLDTALKDESRGIHRFSLVSSGKGIRENSKEFEKIEQIYQILRRNSRIHLCASFGLASISALKRLKNAGVMTYHHNLETSRRYFSQICSTHSYDERIATIQNAKIAGLDLCCGGIFGVGENFLDRIDMAIELRNLEIPSVPINFLSPIKGTPLEFMCPLSKDEMLRIIAIYRFILPKAYLRFAGGRRNLGECVIKGFQGGANATITGDFLTTTGDSVENDKKLIVSLGYKI